MENNKLKKFIKTTIRGFLNENMNIDQYYESDVVYILKRIIEGYPTKLSELDVVYDYFNGEIPDIVKYTGTLYRYMFFGDEDKYNRCLEMGIGCRENSFLRVTKSLDSHEIILDQLGVGYKYYTIFEIEITKDQCIFDVNSLSKMVGVESHYGHEEEVIVECRNLSPSQIIEHDMI